MGVDASTGVLLGVGGTTLAALMGVIANLRINRETTAVSRAQLERQSRADEADELDRAYLRLEKENERLNTALEAERAAHQQTRDEVAHVREEAAQLRAENTVLSVGLVTPARASPRKAPAKKATPRKRSSR